MAAPMARLVEAGAYDALVPMPTTARRIRARGYNQAELLAEEIAECVGIPTRALLERRRGRRSQTSLAPHARRTNVQGAFTVPVPSEVSGLCLLLVDDVLTTGATAGAAATVLVEAGAERVDLVTYARALPRLASRKGGRRVA